MWRKSISNRTKPQNTDVPCGVVVDDIKSLGEESLSSQVSEHSSTLYATMAFNTNNIFNRFKRKSSEEINKSKVVIAKDKCSMQEGIPRLVIS